MSTPTARQALARLIELDKQLPRVYRIGADSQWLNDWYQAIHQARQALAPEVAIPAEQWTDIDGPVLWWMLPINEGQVPHLGHLPPSLRHSQRFVFTRLPPCPVAPTCTPENEAP
jgi:hypothetical protein